MAKKMKLVEILARELKEWPERAICVTQDGDGDLNSSPIEDPEYENKMRLWLARGGLEIFGRLSVSCDFSTSIVTREMWESERAKLAKPKGGKNGWIRNRGGKQPVANGVMVEYRMRSGNQSQVAVAAEDVRWNHSSRLGDIMAYKVVEQAEQAAPESTKDPEKAIETPNPILWRDRVKELDERKLCLDQEHAKHTADIAKEREVLIGKLEAQGFLLISLKKAEASKEWQILAIGEGSLVKAVKAHREEFGSTLEAAVADVREYRRQNGIGL